MMVTAHRTARTWWRRSASAPTTTSPSRSTCRWCWRGWRPSSASAAADPRSGERGRDAVARGRAGGHGLAGRYRLETRIGSGTFGTVFRARTPTSATPVAIKVLQASANASPDALARFRREGITACRVKHPNAVQVLDFGVTAGGVAYLVMELLSGYSLDQELVDGRTVAAGAHGAHHGPGVRGPGRRAPRGHRPPRREAREHLPAPGRRRGGPEGARLRHRAHRRARRRPIRG